MKQIFKKEPFNLLFISILSSISLVFLFFGNHETGLYKTLIILSIIPVMLLPYIIEKLFKVEIDPVIKTLYLTFIFFAHFLGTIMNLYYQISWYDKAMHLFSGIMSAFFALIILVKWKKYDKKNIVWNIVFMILVALSIASFWEFFEFTNDNIFGKDAQRVLKTGVSDTMMDMIMAFFGSIMVCCLYGFEKTTKIKLVVTRLIEKLK